MSAGTGLQCTPFDVLTSTAPLQAIAKRNGTGSAWEVVVLSALGEGAGGGVSAVATATEVLWFEEVIGCTSKVSSGRLASRQASVCVMQRDAHVGSPAGHTSTGVLSLPILVCKRGSEVKWVFRIQRRASVWPEGCLLCRHQTADLTVDSVLNRHPATSNGAQTAVS